MIIFFFGPPGAGKGTQAKLISEELNIVHLSTGEVLREQLKKKSQLSLDLRVIIDSGQLVSDKILNQIVSERIVKNDCKNGFIFDGYPRTITQAIFIDDFFSKNNLSIDYLFEFNIEDNSIIRRIASRAISESRADDSEETIKTRLEHYKLETKPVLDHYKTGYSSIYHIIDGNLEIQKLNSLLLNLLKKP